MRDDDWVLLVRDPPYSLVPFPPIQIDYWHGCIGGWPVAQMANAEESNYFCCELISAEYGPIARRIRAVQRLWRGRRT